MSALGQQQTSKRPVNVCFTPKSGHRNSVVECPLCAKSGLSALRQKRCYSRSSYEIPRDQAIPVAVTHFLGAFESAQMPLQPKCVDGA